MHLICIADLLDVGTLAGTREALTRLPWVDGRQTAGWAARGAKRNLQLDPASADVRALQQHLQGLLAAHPLLRLFARPQRVGLPLLSRYQPGMGYGRHVDDALMEEGRLRTDLAYTLFLSAPEDYDGGELRLESAAGTTPVKLPAGAVVVYEAGALHEVSEVTRGERLAAVGWIQSQVRQAAQREILFDLDRTRREMHAREGDSDAFAALSRCSAALLRMWAEP
jgi:PKHD-type hydroxylase